MRPSDALSPAIGDGAKIAGSINVSGRVPSWTTRSPSIVFGAKSCGLPRDSAGADVGVLDVLPPAARSDKVPLLLLVLAVEDADF